MPKISLSQRNPAKLWRQKDKGGSSRAEHDVEVLTGTMQPSRSLIGMGTVSESHAESSRSRRILSLTIISRFLHASTDHTARENGQTGDDVQENTSPTLKISNNSPSTSYSTPAQLLESLIFATAIVKISLSRSLTQRNFEQSMLSRDS